MPSTREQEADVTEKEVREVIDPDEVDDVVAALRNLAQSVLNPLIREILHDVRGEIAALIDGEERDADALNIENVDSDSDEDDDEDEEDEEDLDDDDDLDDDLDDEDDLDDLDDEDDLDDDLDDEDDEDDRDDEDEAEDSPG